MTEEDRIVSERRKEITDLSDDDLDDELTRPTDNWKEDVLREALRRILRKLK